MPARVILAPGATGDEDRRVGQVLEAVKVEQSVAIGEGQLEDDRVRPHLNGRELGVCQGFHVPDLIAPGFEHVGQH